ncbi:MAG TPA: PRC-barrel domain-containing protein [Candidatus Caenarcaniphilales bacterium]|nr:PRC-barrel domain-containing protein [Candidatus Caenarcaniphilales bacterium]
MSRVIRAAELIGRPVITLDTATGIGEVRDVLFDPLRSRVVGFTLRGRGLLASPLLGILPIEWVQSIGRDAVMVASDTSLVRDRDGMQAVVGQQEEVVGKEVVNEGGASLGTVSDLVLEVDGPSARVVGYEINRPDRRQLIVPVSGRVPVSGNALVLPSDAEHGAATGLTAFRESLERRGEVPRSEIRA